MHKYYKWYVAATIATGVAALALAYMAKQESVARPEGPYKLVTAGSTEMITAKLSKAEYVYIHSPKLACGDRETVGIPTASALVYMRNGQHKSGLWNKHSLTPVADIPEAAIQKAREMCSWYNN